MGAGRLRPCVLQHTRLAAARAARALLQPVHCPPCHDVCTACLASNSAIASPPSAPPCTHAQVFATLGFLSPANRGGLMTAVLLLFCFLGSFAGYSSARLYKTFKVGGRPAGWLG